MTEREQDQKNTAQMKPECNESGCPNDATHQGPSEGGATPNPPIVGWCDKHAGPRDKRL